jgi:hypothetical protein
MPVFLHKSVLKASPENPDETIKGGNFRTHKCFDIRRLAAGRSIPSVEGEVGPLSEQLTVAVNGNSHGQSLKYPPQRGRGAGYDRPSAISF